MDENSKQAPNILTQTLFQRTLFAFDVYLDGQLKDHFLTIEYVDGVIEQKRQSLSRMAKASQRLFIFSIVVLTYIFGMKANVKVFDQDLVDYPLLVELGSLTISMLLMTYMLHLMDYMLLDQFLRKIYSKAINIENPHFIYLNKDAQGIWADMLTLRSFGYKSGGMHKLLAISTVVIFAFLILAVMILGYIALGYANWHIFIESNTHHWIFNGIVVFGDVFAVYTLIIFLFSFIKKVHWPWYENKMNEINSNSPLI